MVDWHASKVRHLSNRVFIKSPCQCSMARIGKEIIYPVLNKKQYNFRNYKEMAR